MEIKLQNLLSLIPVAVLASGLIASYTSLQAQATETTSDVEELTEEVEKIEDQVQELQNKMTRSEIQLETAVDDISEVKGDTRAILNLLQRQPTQD